MALIILSKSKRPFLWQKRFENRLYQAAILFGKRIYALSKGKDEVKLRNREELNSCQNQEDKCHRNYENGHCKGREYEQELAQKQGRGKGQRQGQADKQDWLNQYVDFLLRRIVFVDQVRVYKID